MLKVNRPEPVPHIMYTVGTGGIKKGQIAVVSGNTAVAATEGVSTAIVLGIALDTVAENGIVQIECMDGSLIEADVYQGGATDVFAAGDVGKAFDIYVNGSTGEMYIDPNDTTDPMFVVMSYDNAKAKAWLKIKKALLYLV